MDEIQYPTDRKKSGYFARFSKALFASEAIAQHGASVVLLSLFVASREDRLHYSKAPKFWRAELTDRLGFGSFNTLAKVRREAISAGLIHYQEGTRTTPAVYWTLTPNWLEPFMRRAQKVNAKRATRSKSERQSERQTERESERILEPNNPVTQYKKRPKFKPPTLEEVKAYCQERHSKVNPEQFHDHYTANGWVQGKGKPLRDWQAAVRTWERNGVNQQATAKPDPSHRPFPARRVPK